MKQIAMCGIADRRQNNTLLCIIRSFPFLILFVAVVGSVVSAAGEGHHIIQAESGMFYLSKFIEKL